MNFFSCIHSRETIGYKVLVIDLFKAVDML